MRWYLVDDHDAFRAVAQRLLESAQHVVVGESDGTDGTSDTIDAVLESGAEAVLLDVALPSTDGFTLADGLAATSPGMRCVLISSRPRSAYENRLNVSPAIGFVSKADLSIEALDALLG